MKESLLCNVLVFFADTPKSAAWKKEKRKEKSRDGGKTFTSISQKEGMKPIQKLPAFFFFFFHNHAHEVDKYFLACKAILTVWSLELQIQKQ